LSDVEKSLFDLVPTGPVRSGPFDFKGKKWQWRLLDGKEDIAVRLAAQRHASDQLMESLDIERRESLELLQTGFNADILTEWHDWYRLAAALTLGTGSPIRDGSPSEIAQWMADEYTPLERLDLLTRYLAFCDDNDPANIDDDETEEIIATAGKPQGRSALRSSGSPVLRHCLHITAVRLHEAETKLAEMMEQEDLAARIEAVELVISRMPKSSVGGDSGADGAPK